MDGVIGGTATGSESLKNLVLVVYARGCITVVIDGYRLFSSNEHVQSARPSSNPKSEIDNQASDRQISVTTPR